MNFQLFVNGNLLFGGNIFAFFLVVVILVLLAIGLVKEIRRRLRQNEDMKYEFVTIIAHKFRTPLTQMKWRIEEILSFDLDPSQKERLSDINASNERLISLTGTLLDVTNSDKESKVLYKFERVSLCDFVKEVSQPFKDVCHGKNIFFSVGCESEDIFAKVDRPRMEFVLQTLLENSCNYTPIGRNIDVIVSKTPRNAIISVKDAGIGIEQKDLPHIFENFYRAENAKRVDTEGVGVGLFLAQSIAKRHKGRIEVYSEGKDKGSTFQVVLPRVG